MGTTIVAAIVSGDMLSVAHVGDSRLYAFGPDGLRQITADDSWVASQRAENPSASAAFLQHHPMSHALTNVVGVRKQAKVHVSEQVLTAGEVVVLTTDGVHGSLDERCIERLWVDGGDARALAAGLVQAALSRGSRDNCTAVVAQYVPD